jgi:hypothetical protein
MYTIKLIERHWWISCIFLSGLITVNFGLLNLVLAAIVDTAEKARQIDQDMLLDDKARGLSDLKKKLLQLCSTIDADGSGHIKVEELREAWDTVYEFRDALTMMDLDKNDVEVVYGILDEDGSGSISYTEFVEQFYKMKTQDSHTLLVFIKSYISEIRDKIREEMDILKVDLLRSARQQEVELHEIMSALHIDVSKEQTIEKAFSDSVKDQYGALNKLKTSSSAYISESLVELEASIIRQGGLTPSMVAPSDRHLSGSQPAQPASGEAAVSLRTQDASRVPLTFENRLTAPEIKSIVEGQQELDMRRPADQELRDIANKAEDLVALLSRLRRQQGDGSATGAALKVLEPQEQKLNENDKLRAGSWCSPTVPAIAAQIQTTA